MSFNLLPKKGLSRAQVEAEIAEALAAQLPDYVENVDPRLITGGPFAYQAANTALFYRVPEPHKALTIGTMRYNCATASGNILLGYYTFDGTTLTRLAVSASTAVVTGTNSVTIPNPVEAPAENLYLAINCDNTTATFRGFNSIGAVAASENRVLAKAIGSFDLPATVTSATSSVGQSIWLLGKA